MSWIKHTNNSFFYDRCGLKYKIVEGDSGAMGGSDSHEFMAISDVGESAIAYCDECNYAATDEKAICSYEINEINTEKLSNEKVHTPNIKTIDELSEFFSLSSEKFVKTLIYKVKDEIVAVLIPGNRELNDTKLINYFRVPEHEVEMADSVVVKEITGAEIGFAGPINFKKEIKVLIDSKVSKMKNFIVGANETDYHIKNVNIEDFNGEIVEDLLLVREGDNCPKCNSKIKIERGIEVGNIFQLGTKYSAALNAKYSSCVGPKQNSLSCLSCNLNISGPKSLHLPLSSHISLG